MFNVATLDNPTAIPPTATRRQRDRDVFAWNGHRIVRSLSDQVAYLDMLRFLRKHPDKARRINATAERVLRDILVRQSGDNPDDCPQVSAIAYTSGISERQTQRVCRDAKALGILEVRPRQREPRSKRATVRALTTTNRYVLTMPSRDEVGVIERHVEQAEPVDKTATRSCGVTICHPSTDSYVLPPLSTGNASRAVYRLEREGAQEKAASLLASVRSERAKALDAATNRPRIDRWIEADRLCRRNNGTSVTGSVGGDLGSGNEAIGHVEQQSDLPHHSAATVKMADQRHSERLTRPLNVLPGRFYYPTSTLA